MTTEASEGNDVVERQEEAGGGEQEGGRRRRGTQPEDLLIALRWLAVRMGRTPRAMDINVHLPATHTTYFEVFGSLTEAQEAAGLQPNRQGGQKEAPGPPESFLQEWAWLAGYADPKKAIEAARRRREERDEEEAEGEGEA